MWISFISFLHITDKTLFIFNYRELEIWSTKENRARIVNKNESYGLGLFIFLQFY